MPFEKFDLENLDKERRKAIANSIRTISVEELKAIGEQIFRYADDPWREAFFAFIAQNPLNAGGAVVRVGVDHDSGARLLNLIRYCHTARQQAWKAGRQRFCRRDAKILRV